jgi:hypothetical protein
MQLGAQFHGRLMQRLSGGRGPQIELVSCGTAAEAAVGVSNQVRGEREASGALRRVQRAWATDLVATAVRSDKAQQLQNGFEVHFSA